MKRSVTEIFGMYVFNETVMHQCLPANIYESLRKTMKYGSPLEKNVADVVASAMKDWAIEKGATHYTHWFQPMTGITAEKHDAFIVPAGDGKVVEDFSGKELIIGEPDASSFPSGGLRATFEARGYTAWDPTSYAFVKDNTLYIPTAFCSYSGQVLDKKTPLLRSMEALNTQVMRVLKVLDNPAERTCVMVGPEQEYFLVDEELFNQRQDLFFTGRTLFGAEAPKSQEMSHHYFGNLKERVSAFMKEVDSELWKYGVYAKTKHNEAAPAQHELAPIYTNYNLASDQNQLTMEVMKKVASHHNLVCLLQEKPFEYVNGSGKHNNWSLCTDKGENLLSPGKNPSQNLTFLLTLSAVIMAVSKYGDLMRVSIASAGNDHRLGANEAPPAIVSIFLGDDLYSILEKFAVGENTAPGAKPTLETGVASLPVLFKDTTDRNRTSPMAFTGNKFEFRMPGSSQSISGVNTILNTIIADSFRVFADRLEKATDVNAEVNAIIKDVFKEHNRVLFNGNNYSDEWVKEAERRGLPNLRTSVDAIPEFIADKNIELFKRHGIYTEEEAHARYEIYLENYVDTINIEAKTMLEMAKRQILPACMCFNRVQFETLNAKKQYNTSLNLDREEDFAVKISDYVSDLMGEIDNLDALIKKCNAIEDLLDRAKAYRDEMLPQMAKLRKVADTLETYVADEYWPFPTYSELLFSV